MSFEPFIATGRDRAAGVPSVEVIGPETRLAARVARLLAHHGARGAAPAGRARVIRPVVKNLDGKVVARGGGFRAPVVGMRKTALGRAKPGYYPGFQSKVFLVSALKPDGTTEVAEVHKRIELIRQHEPKAPVFVLLDEANQDAVRAARLAGATDYIGAATAQNPAALEWRVTEALDRAARRVSQLWSEYRQRVERSRSSRPTLGVQLGAPVEPTAAEVAAARTRVEAGIGALPSRGAALARAEKLVSVAAPELRDLQSGRFDARRIADRLGVATSRLAPATGVSQQALSARPSSPRAQPALASMARVLAALDELLPPEQVKMWLNTPHPRLGDEPPRELLLQGRAGPVARLVESALEGIPD